MSKKLRLPFSFPEIESGDEEETNMLSCWRSGSHSVIISLSHLVLICYFDELVGGVGDGGDSPETTTTHTHTHTHNRAREPSPHISLIECDMWLAAFSILQICTLTRSRMPWFWNAEVISLLLCMCSCLPLQSDTHTHRHTDTHTHGHTHILRKLQRSQ